jgi:hypothetical protein
MSPTICSRLYRADLGRRLGATVSAHVGRDRAISARRERGQLPAPRIPPFGKAVTQQYEGSVSLLGDVDANAVRPQLTVSKIVYRHVFSA